MKIFKWLLLCAFIEAFSGSLCNILFSFVRPLDDKSSVVWPKIPLHPFNSFHFYYMSIYMNMYMNGIVTKASKSLSFAAFWIKPNREERRGEKSSVEPAKCKKKINLSISTLYHHPFVPLYDSIRVLFIIDKLIIHKICNKLWPLHRIVGTLIVIYWEFGLKCVVVASHLNHIRIGNQRKNEGA